MLEDHTNFKIPRLCAMIEYGKNKNADFNEFRLLETLLKNLIRPDIS